MNYSNESDNFPFVSVIIPAYNEEKRIGNAIEAVSKQTYPKDKLEIIVVDDGSTDRTCEVVSRYPVKLIRHNINKGDSAARNTGAKNAMGEIIATTDADDRVDKDWLINLIKHYNDANVGSVVGSSRVVYNEENWQQRIIAELTICLRGSDRVKKLHDAQGKVGSNKSIGSNQSFKRSVFEEIGGYDMGLTAGMDQDIVWRVEKAGYTVAFELNAVVYITPIDSFKKYIKQPYSRERGAVTIRFEHPDKITLRYLFNMLYLPIIVGMSISGILFNIGLFMYFVMVVMVLPVGYYLIKLLKGREYIKKPTDAILILIIGYIGFVIASLSILRWCFDIRNYKEKQQILE